MSSRWAWWCMVILAANGLVVAPLYFAHAIPIAAVNDTTKVALIFLPFSVASVGLLVFKNWARVLYIVSCAAFSAMVLGTEPFRILISGGRIPLSVYWPQYVRDTLVPNLPSLLLSGLVIAFLGHRRVAKEFSDGAASTKTL